MSDTQPDVIEYADVAGLLQEWRDEIAKTRTRARHWDGSLTEEYRMKGKAAGMDVARHELEQVLRSQDTETEQ